jgi:hypothetical protein
MIDLTPNPHVLHAMMNSPLSWHHGLAELIDNSYDHGGATRVEIRINGNIVSVVDDGKGVDDVTACFRYGDHRVSKREGISRYGVGAKDVWHAMANIMCVTSIRNGIKTTASADCEKMAGHSFAMDDPVVEPCNSAPGTMIELHLRKGKQKPRDEAIEKLSWMFTPGLRKGLQIVISKRSGQSVNKKALKPVELPLLNDVVESNFDIDGKGVYIRIGIVADGHKMVNGPFWLIRQHRIISGSGLGIKNGYGCKRVGGEIHLGKEWSLAKHKDSLTEDSDRLRDAIFERIEPVLKKADSIAETFESAALRNDLAEMLDAAIENAECGQRCKKKKQKRENGSLSGTVLPKHSGRKQTKTKKPKPDDGPYIDESNGIENGSIRKHGPRIQFDWKQFGDHRVGEVDALGKFIWLNSDNKYVASLIHESRKPELFLLIASILADHDCRHEGSGQSLLAFNYADFGLSFGSIISEFEGGKNEQSADAI